MDESAKKRYQQIASTYLLEAFADQANDVTMGILIGIQLHESAPEEGMRFLNAMLEKEHSRLRMIVDQFAAHMRDEW